MITNPVFEITLIAILGVLAMVILLSAVGVTIQTLETIHNIPKFYDVWGAKTSLEKLTVANFVMTLTIYISALIMALIWIGLVCVSAMFDVAKKTFTVEKRGEVESSKMDEKNRKPQNRRH